MPKWAVKYISDIALKTGFTRERVLDDLLKAGAVALKGRYQSIVTYRASVEDLWNEPMEPAGRIIKPTPDEQENTEPVDWTPDSNLFGNGQPETESATIGRDGFNPAEIGPGQLAANPTSLEEPEPSVSEPDSERLEDGRDYL